MVRQCGGYVCVLQCVAVCCSMFDSLCFSVMQYVAASLTFCVAVCCSVLQCVAVCCSVLQCVAVCLTLCVNTKFLVLGVCVCLFVSLC